MSCSVLSGTLSLYTTTLTTHFERKFKTEGGVTHQPLLVQKTRVIDLSCSIKISAVHCLVLSQSICVADR